MSGTPPTTQQKALAINLAAKWYGSFAEIGGGQEVGRWFFKVGGAAGTVAKTISAYDMAISDAVYGQSKRYVSRERLQAMLEHEFTQVADQLRNWATSGLLRPPTRPTGDSAALSTAAAGSVSASGGRREPSQITYAHLLDGAPGREQEALGVWGEPLHGAFFLPTPRPLATLMDELARR
jgi:hypothetical protein